MDCFFIYILCHIRLTFFCPLGTKCWIEEQHNWQKIAADTINNLFFAYERCVEVPFWIAELLYLTTMDFQISKHLSDINKRKIYYYKNTTTALIDLLVIKYWTLIKTYPSTHCLFVFQKKIFPFYYQNMPLLNVQVGVEEHAWQLEKAAKKSKQIKVFAKWDKWNCQTFFILFQDILNNWFSLNHLQLKCLWI